MTCMHMSGYYMNAARYYAGRDVAVLKIPPHEA